MGPASAAVESAEQTTAKEQDLVVEPEAASPIQRAAPAPADTPPAQRPTRPTDAVAADAAVQRYARPPAASSPKFSALKSDVKGKQRSLAAHPPPASKANAAQAAAKPPADDKQAQGKAANAEKMNAAKPGTFDKVAFIAAVNKAISEQAPKNLDEADNFGDSGKADAVKGQVQGQVGQGKEQSAKQIETTTKAAPDTSAAKEKQVTPLAQEPAPGNPGTPNPANAVPDKAPASATDFSAGPKQVDHQMADAQVTEEQLAKSNEPEFTGALKEKKAGEEHAATAPGEVRAAENQTLTGAKAGAKGAAAGSIEAMRGQKQVSNTAVGKGQQGAQSKDEQQRAQVTAKLQTVFDATQKDVEGILTGLDKKVDDAFSSGEKAARDAFTAEHKRRMDDYKDKRYSGFTGKLKWVKDKFAGLPEEANQIFVTARQGYVTRMQTVISTVADVIGGELNRAKQRIATGRQQLQAEVQKLPAELQSIGKEAAGEFSGKFDELTESVDAKGKELVQTLASKYNEALKSVDAEIEAEKEKNKGLIAKAVDAVKGVLDTILKLKDLLLGVLAKAAQAVMAILKDPIGFLGNLVSAVGAGLKAFMNNIGAHLKKGLIDWLLGAMSGAGLQLPEKFDLRGILSMIASLLGLTWGAIRGRIMQKGIPEQAMSAVEAGVPIVAKLQSQGVAGAYEEIKDQVGDLKENLLGKISEYLIPTVLIAGITWIVSLLNPASAFIKACKMIIDIVTFIIERGAQIIEFVNAVLDAVIAIAGGGAGGVPALIEGALAKSIPVLIGALAAILGVGGIATKVKSFFQALSKPVMKAVDWVVAKIVKLGKAIWNKIKPKGKGKDADGKDPNAPAVDLKLSQGTDMAGEGHTVFAEVKNGQVRIEMASERRRWIGGLITNALAKEKAGANRSQLITYLNGMDRQVKEMERMAAGRITEAQKAKAEAQLVEITRALQVIGQMFQMHDLTDFTKTAYAAGGVLLPEYRNGDKLRATFYPGWNSAAQSEKRKQLKAHRDRFVAEKATWDPAGTHTGSNWYICPGNGTTAPHLTDKTTTTGLPAIDHKFEVSAQWNDKGHNTPQSPRETWYNDISNHATICTSCNGSKSGPDYKPDVGPDFRGPGDPL